jgi:hypothetical protein
MSNRTGSDPFCAWALIRPGRQFILLTSTRIQARHHQDQEGRKIDLWSMFGSSHRGKS